MPTVVITPNKGQAITVHVGDKSEAIRVVSERLRTLFTDKFVTDALNEWLRSSMKNPLRIQVDNDKMLLTYIP